MYVTVANPHRMRRYRRGLGAPVNTGGIIASGAGTATTAIVSSVGADTALGSWAGPIGAGVGAVVGILAGLWSAHNARVKGAKAENQVVGSALQTWDAAIQAIFQGANSGALTGAQAAQLVQQQLQTYWAAVAQVRGMPGVADNSSGGARCGSYTSGVTPPCSPGHPCTKACTAGCCVGCNDLWTSTLDAVRVLNSPTGGTFNVCTVYSSGYGLAQRPQYSVTYTPPAGSTGTVASALGLSGSTVLGIPTWLLAAGGIGAAIWFGTR
jgi:hypothetical protein